MWVAWQPDWEEKVFSLFIRCCRVVVWCDSVRDENLPHHTRIDFFLPQLTQSHRSGRISFTASSQSRKSCSLWYWSFFSCDVITWRLSPWQYWCKINSPRHDITSTRSAFISPACLCFFCPRSFCGVRCWTVVGRGWPPVRLGAWALWLWGGVSRHDSIRRLYVCFWML